MMGGWHGYDAAMQKAKSSYVCMIENSLIESARNGTAHFVIAIIVYMSAVGFEPTPSGRTAT